MNPPAKQEAQVQSLGWEDPLEKAMATCSSILASPDFGHSIGEENGNPLQCSCLDNPRDGGAWWAAVYGFSIIATAFLGKSSCS